jgi:hypothetical protein
VNVLARLGSHLGDAAKRDRIRYVTLIRCRDRQQMDDTERRLIQLHRPEWNTAGIPRED